MTTRALMLLLTLLVAFTASAEKKAKLNIAITATSGTSGFVVRDRVDSAKDLTKAISKGSWGRGTKWMTVRGNEPAVFNVIITGRGSAPGVDFGPSIRGDYDVSVDRTRFVHYEVRIDGKRIMSGNGVCETSVHGSTTWYGAANDIRKQLERFVEDNYDQLTRVDD